MTSRLQTHTRTLIFINAFRVCLVQLKRRIFTFSITFDLLMITNRKIRILCFFNEVNEPNGRHVAVKVSRRNIFNSNRKTTTTIYVRHSIIHFYVNIMALLT